MHKYNDTSNMAAVANAPNMYTYIIRHTRTAINKYKENEYKWKNNTKNNTFRLIKLVSRIQCMHTYICIDICF